MASGLRPQTKTLFRKKKYLFLKHSKRRVESFLLNCGPHVHMKINCYEYIEFY